MKVNLYSVLDSAAGAFMQPFYQASDGLALRLFSDAVEDKNTSIAKHPVYFSLWHVGEFDDQNALVSPVVPPRHLAKAVDFLSADDLRKTERPQVMPDLPAGSVPVHVSPARAAFDATLGRILK